MPSNPDITTRDVSAGPGLLRKVEEGPPYPHGPPSSLEHRPLVLGLESQPYWGLAPLEAPYKVAL